MRIISGKFKGKKLLDGYKLDLRPTTDRNRESLFNVLNSLDKGFDLKGAIMLDLCCGTGLVGFEALSRGVKKCVFVDINKKHLEVVKKNKEILLLEEEVEILNLDAMRLPKFLNNYKFDLIFIDPPYEKDYSRIFDSLGKLGVFANNCLVIVEFKRGMRMDFYDEAKFQRLFIKEYGNSCFGFLGLI
ncbi:MAG: 16S rRNA (guanine(966)-N(2))-methyltransferase RsmD [Rickettsiales bacterium]|nr:16S rRNA (guanine(966)-N(2))-methyltransferase RsmD [Rickettsiales bacterium]